MNQLIVVGISFVVMFFLLKKKVNFGLSMTITAIILTLLSGFGFEGVISVAVDTLKSPKTFDTCAAVFCIGILGGLCGKYGLLDKIVDSLGDLISSRKIIAMIIPALMGMMPIPGGAVMSVPFIDKLGDDIELSAPRKSAINLVFRHLSMMVMPYSTSILMIASSLATVGIYEIIPMNFVFMIMILIPGYFCFIKNVKVINHKPSNFSLKALGNFLLYMSPIYVCIVLNFFFGLPIYVGGIISFGIVYLLSNKHNFLKNFKDSLNFNVLWTILGVLILQNAIGKMTGLIDMFTGSLGTGLSSVFIMAIGAGFFSFITGMSLTSLGILFPIIAALDISHGAMLVYAYAVFVGGYIGYFFSPLHLCQVFTNEFLKVSTGDLYKEYKIYLISCVVAAVVTTIGFYFLLF